MRLRRGERNQHAPETSESISDSARACSKLLRTFSSSRCPSRHRVKILFHSSPCTPCKIWDVLTLWSFPTSRTEDCLSSWTVRRSSWTTDDCQWLARPYSRGISQAGRASLTRTRPAGKVHTSSEQGWAHDRRRSHRVQLVRQDRDPEATIVKKATDFTTDSGDLRALDHLPKNPALRRKRGRAELRSPFNAS